MFVVVQIVPMLLELGFCMQRVACGNSDCMTRITKQQHYIWHVPFLQEPSHFQRACVAVRDIGSDMVQDVFFEAILALSL